MCSQTGKRVHADAVGVTCLPHAACAQPVLLPPLPAQLLDAVGFCYGLSLPAFQHQRCSVASSVSVWGRC